MKKITMVALSIIVLANLTGIANAETTTPVAQAEKQLVAAAEKGDQAKKQHKISEQADKQQSAPQIGSKTDEAQGRGLPKAFSGSEEK
jgi:hypothetical protein